MILYLHLVNKREKQFTKRDKRIKKVQIIDGNLNDEMDFDTEDLICIGISSMIGH